MAKGDMGGLCKKQRPAVQQRRIQSLSRSEFWRLTSTKTMIMQRLEPGILGGRSDGWCLAIFYCWNFTFQLATVARCFAIRLLYRSYRGALEKWYGCERPGWRYEKSRATFQVMYKVVSSSLETGVSACDTSLFDIGCLLLEVSSISTKKGRYV